MLPLTPGPKRTERPMKRLLLVFSAMLLAATLACAQEVSLGDAARAAREKKGGTSPNGKVYDNENLPRGGNISTTTGDFAGVPTPPASKSKSSSATSTSASNSSAPSTSAKDKDGKDVSAEQAAKEQADEYRQKVDDAKKAISSLEHEIDIMNRENRLKAAAYYGDAGTKLRDGQKYQAEDQKQQETLKA